MNPIDVQTLANAIDGQLLSGDGSRMVTAGVCTDTRKITEGCAFFALIGDRFDAHDFLTEAAKSAAIIIVSKVPPCELPSAIIHVPDTLMALQRLAAWYRRQLDITVIGITGSSGKTSTKDLTKAVLSQKFDTFATQGNLNNHIGVPLSILSLTERQQMAVIEMGMNHQGEIAPLCEIAAPDHGIITNIGTAHIENLGSRRAIAEEKGALARSLASKGTLVLPAACDFASYLAARCRGRTLFTGNGRGFVRAENLRTLPIGTEFTLIIGDQQHQQVVLPTHGKHMVSNALLAATIGYLAGLNLEQIATGLATSQVTAGRLRHLTYQDIGILDDTYNANPESMAAALDTLAELPCSGRRIAVLGFMGELGQHSDQAHRRIGDKIKRLGIDLLVCVGKESFRIAEAAHGAELKIEQFTSTAEAGTHLRDIARPHDLILFKGSRTAAIENVIQSAFPDLK